VITQYLSWNHFHHQWIGRQNKKLQIKCIPVQEKIVGKKCAAGQIFYETKCATGKTYQIKCAAGQFF